MTTSTLEAPGTLISGDLPWKGLLTRARARKTLVICPIGLGNFIMATPSLKLLSEQLGKDNLHLLALRKGVKQMAELSGYVGAIHYWDPDQESKAAGLKTLMALRREKFDYCLLLFPSNNWRYVLYTVFAGARVRVGFDYPNTKLPARWQHYSKPLNVDAHDTDQNSDLIEELLGIVSDEPRVQLFPYVPEHPLMDELRRADYFVLQPGSSVERGMIEKRMPPEIFGEIAKRIHAEFGVKCVILGGEEQESLKREIAAYAPEAMLPYASKNFNELAALTVNARFYLGNDSGLMHIAAALNRPCVIFYGQTDEKRCGPYSDGLRRGEKGNHLILRREGLACSPCWTAKTVGANPPCIYGDKRCLTGFTFAMAWPKISRFVRALVAEQQPVG